MMVRFFIIGFCMALFLAEPVFAAKNEGPFQKSNVLKQSSRIELKTAEIAAYMPSSQKLFVVGDANTMEVVDFSNGGLPVRLGEFSLDGEATSVTVSGNLIAVSLLAKPTWETGFVELLKYDVQDSASPIKKLGTHKVCYHPDMLTFTPDGKNILVACEGEPSEDGIHDPLGGIAFLNMENELDPGISIFSFPDSTYEPEYITVSGDSKYAWVSLQENNKMALVNVNSRNVEQIFDLGFVDHSKPGFGLDAIKDKKIRIESAFIRSLRQPDGIKAFNVDGKNYVVTANEGEDRANFDPKIICGNEEKCSVKFGSRSISIFEGMSGKLIWDSGETLERTFAEVAPEYFNWNSKKGKKKMDARSDDKGCEPENVVVGMVKDANGVERRLAFVGLERMSGIAVFDFTNVGKENSLPVLLDYFMDPKDRGPEGVLFVSADKSPIPGQALLIVGYEYSKSLVVYTVKL